MKRLFIAVVVLVFSISLVIIGCAEPAPTTPAPTTPAPTTPAPTTPAPTTPAPTTPAPTTPAPTTPAPTTPTPKVGGILKIRCSLPMDIGFGDPMTIFGPFTMRASISLERLFLPGEKAGTFQNVLATGYKLAADKSYYDISLRQGVTFHDGTPFNAEAVKWNLDRIKAANKPELAKVTSIEVVDDYTIRLNLSAWANNILNDLTHDCGYIVSPTAWDKNGKDWADFHPIGTGPFMFKEIRNNQIVVWEKNPNYWEKGLPYLDGIEFHFIPDHTATSLALKAGEVDGSWEGANLPTQAELAEDPENWKLWDSDGEFAGGFYMNTIEPTSAWYDPRMRQALEYATDKEGIVNTLGEVPWSYPIYTIIKGIEESAPSDIVPRKYDPAKAKELMTAAGYPDGLKFTLNITIENYREHTDVFTAYQDKWRAVGFDAEIQVNEVAVGREIGLKPLPGNDANYYVLRGNKITPSAVMIESLVEGSTTWVGVKRPEEWPNLLEQALQTEDVDKTLSILAQMNKIAYDQAMAVPSHIDPLVSIVRTYVKDYDIIREGQVIRKAWLDK